MTHHEHDQPLEGKRAAVAVGPLYEEIEGAPVVLVEVIAAVG